MPKKTLWIAFAALPGSRLNLFERFVYLLYEIMHTN